MNLMPHHPAAHQRQLHDRSMNGALHRSSAQSGPKRNVVRPGACSLEFVGATGWAERDGEMATRETLPHEIDANKLAALMLAMASRRISCAARTYVAACIGGGALRGAESGKRFDREVSDSVKSSVRASLCQRPGWRAMARSLSCDPTVITYFLRPACVVVSIVADDGSAVPAATYAPDLVVVRNDEIVVIEVRNEQVEVNPRKEHLENFFFAPTGSRGYPRPYQLFKSMGIRYECMALGHTGSVA